MVEENPRTLLELSAIEDIGFKSLVTVVVMRENLSCNYEKFIALHKEDKCYNFKDKRHISLSII